MRTPLNKLHAHYHIPCFTQGTTLGLFLYFITSVDKYIVQKYFFGRFLLQSSNTQVAIWNF